MDTNTDQLMFVGYSVLHLELPHEVEHARDRTQETRRKRMDHAREAQRMRARSDACVVEEEVEEGTIATNDDELAVLEGTFEVVT